MNLIISQFGKKLLEMTLEEGKEYFLGRSADCDILLEDSSLSRKHLKIYKDSETNFWKIEVLSKKSELYFEGEELTSFEIQMSCLLNLKKYVLNFISEDSQMKSLQEAKTVVDSKKHSTEIKEFKTRENLNEDEVTQIVSDQNLLYSLSISIEEEFSDYINLNIGKRWLIGRSEECDISIDYGFLTRKHLEIERKDNFFYVKDLGSANKTYLNEEELKSQKSYQLKINDEISIADLKIVFEIRDTKYHDKIKNLPAPLSSEEEEDSPEMIAPKVILEDFFDEDLEENSNRTTKKNKRVIFLASLILILAGALYFKNESRKKKEKIQAQEQQNKKKKESLNIMYQDVQKNFQAGNYLECINQINRLHEEFAVDFYEDSQQILTNCQNGLALLQQKKAEEEAEKLRLETEAKIDKLANKCKQDYDKGKIKTTEDLNECAEELLTLDPTNTIISQIKMSIAEKVLKKQLAEEKRKNYRKWISSKKRLYNKAEEMKNQKADPLKTVLAYDTFLRASRGISSLKEIHDQAQKTRDQIQSDYDSQLKFLRSSCQDLVDDGEFKKAHDSCKKVLKFKPYDQMAEDNIEEIKDNLEKILQPIYEESQWHENFSRIKEARQLWEQILTEDIKDGKYYKKALAQIRKYK